MNIERFFFKKKKCILRAIDQYFSLALFFSSFFEASLRFKGPEGISSQHLLNGPYFIQIYPPEK